MFCFRTIFKKRNYLMKARLIILFLIFSSSLRLSSTEVEMPLDTLLYKLENAQPDTAKIAVLNDIALLMFRTDPNQAIKFSRKAQMISEKENYFKHQAITNNAFAAASWLLANYNDAIEAIHKNIKIYEDQNNQKGIAKSFHHLSLILTETENIDLALEYSSKSIAISLKNDYKTLLASALSQSGLIYNDFTKNTFKAEEHFSRALVIYKELNDTLKCGYSENNLGRVYYSNREYKRALISFEKALQICVKYRANLGICHTLNNIGEVYMDLQKYDTAKKYFLESIDTAEYYKILKLESRGYQLLAKVDSSMHNYLSAINNYNKYYQLENELLSKEKEDRISELHIKYETVKQKQENELLKKNDKINTLLVRLMAGTILLILVVLIFIWRLLRIKQKNNISLNNKNEEIIKQKNEIHSQKETVQKQAKELFEHKNQLEEQVTKRTLELIESKEHAEESDRLKTAFLNNISHEYRTPMNGILGFVDLLIDEETNKEERREYSKFIRKSCDKLLHLVVDTVEVSKIHSRQEEMIKSEVNIQDVLSSVLKEYADELKNKGLQSILEIDCTPQQLVIHTDESKITRIIGHLIDNAVKFTHQGFVKLICKADDDCFLRFQVEDSGIGISEELLEVVFDPFRQEETSSRRNFGGSGIGLTLVKSYVELLDGEIGIESEIGKGTSVYFSIPLEPCYVEPTKQKQKNHQILETKTILIADDNKMNYILISKLLASYKCKILHAWNGKEAVDFFIDNKQHIDLILMDLNMPVLDGYMASKLIKEIDPNIPIIAQTAYTLNRVVDNSLLINFEGFISKPINTKKLIRIIMQNI